MRIECGNDDSSVRKLLSPLETQSLAYERKHWERLSNNLKVSIKLVDGTEITSPMQAKSRNSVHKHYTSKEFQKRFTAYEHYKARSQNENHKREKIIEYNLKLPASLQKPVPELIVIKSFAEWQNS